MFATANARHAEVIIQQVVRCRNRSVTQAGCEFSRLSARPERPDQIMTMTVTKERLAERIGMLAPGDIHGIDFALRVQLGLAS